MKEGYKKIEGFISDSTIRELESVLRKFHSGWLIKNESIFKNGAINNAYITNGEFISPEERLVLLRFVSSKKIVDLARSVLGNDLVFLNTQIFFDPFNPSQNNYWHRDIQYTGQSESEQKKTIENKESQVIHIRIAFRDEKGIEFIPGSHFAWDKKEELDVRLKREGRQPHHDLEGGEIISLKRGNLLIFDANIIHRGHYGGERFSFDILFCRPLPEIIKYVSKETLPSKDELKSMECPEVFRLQEA